MTMRDTVGVYDQAEFADNPEARCSIVLILDVSGSMAWPEDRHPEPGPVHVPRRYPERLAYGPAGGRGRD